MERKELRMEKHGKEGTKEWTTMEKKEHKNGNTWRRRN